MTGPAWLGSTLGMIVLLAGAAALARLVVAWRVHRPTDAEVDIHNVLMGVSMAGVLIPQLLIVTPGAATTAWLVVWIIVTAWFVVSVARDASRGDPGRRFAGHHVPHLVMSAAMVFMFSAGDRPVPGVAGLGFVAGLAYAFVAFMVGYVVLVVDRIPVIAVAGVGDVRAIGWAVPASVTSAEPVAPRLAAATNVVMALTMGYMLVLLFG